MKPGVVEQAGQVCLGTWGTGNSAYPGLSCSQVTENTGSPSSVHRREPVLAMLLCKHKLMEAKHRRTCHRGQT